jgi:GNAT superfamily N-acetyltransferase
VDYASALQGLFGGNPGHDPGPAGGLAPYLGDPFEAAAARTRRSVKPEGGRQQGTLTEIMEAIVPHLAQRAMAGPDAMRRVFEGQLDPMSPEGIGEARGIALQTLGQSPFAVRGLGVGGGKMVQPVKVSDDGTRINITPHDMEVPEWGKDLTWGLTAYRTKINGEDAIRVRDARLPPEMQGQGHGTAMYEHAADLAAKEGKPLLSDGTVTQDAASRWMALNRAGYNVQMAPNKVFRPGPPEAPQLGRFETSDGSPVFRVAPEK